MKVHFEVPDIIWARIVETAEKRGTSVAHLMSVAALSLVQKDTGKEIRAVARRERVLGLVRAGFSDAEVATMTGELKQYVTTNRRRVGLPANRQIRSGRDD